MIKMSFLDNWNKAEMKQVLDGNLFNLFQLIAKSTFLIFI